MNMLLSGVQVFPEYGTPTLEDIALGLGRIWRFVGQTSRPYTVLHHTLAGYRWIVREGGRDSGSSVLPLVYWLLHDAHECVTGDVPTPWKTRDIQKLQGALDRRIWRSFGLEAPGEAEARVVSMADAVVLWAEARLLAAPGAASYIWERVSRHKEFASGIPDGRKEVRAILRLYPGGHDTACPTSRAVRRYMALVRKHLRELKGG